MKAHRPFMRMVFPPAALLLLAATLPVLGQRGQPERERYELLEITMSETETDEDSPAFSGLISGWVRDGWRRIKGTPPTVELDILGSITDKSAYPMAHYELGQRNGAVEVNRGTIYNPRYETYNFDWKPPPEAFWSGQRVEFLAEVQGKPRPHRLFYRVLGRDVEVLSVDNSGSPLADDSIPADQMYQRPEVLGTPGDPPRRWKGRTIASIIANPSSTATLVIGVFFANGASDTAIYYIYGASSGEDDPGVPGADGPADTTGDPTADPGSAGRDPSNPGGGDPGSSASGGTGSGGRGSAGSRGPGSNGGSARDATDGDQGGGVAGGTTSGRDASGSRSGTAVPPVTTPDGSTWPSDPPWMPDDAPSGGKPSRPPWATTPSRVYPPTSVSTPEGSASDRALLAERMAGSQGAEITVPVYLYNPRGLRNINFEISYDSAIVQLLDPEPRRGEGLPSSAIYSASGGNGRIRIGLASNADMQRSSVISYLSFRVTGSEGQSTPLTLSVREAETGTGQATLALYDGRLDVVRAETPGDVNRNGAPDAWDAQAALDMSTGKRAVDLVADMNGSGDVTSKDARLILEAAVRGESAER